MAHREQIVANQAKEICHRYGAYITQGDRLDCIVCFKGKFLAIEFKAGYNKTTALQEREIAAVHKAGGAAMVVREDTLDELTAWFERN